MALEQRGNNSYYYRKRWVNGTCQSEYVGGGAFAHLVAEIEALERLPARQEAAAFRKVRSQIKQQATLILGTEVDIRELVKAVLIANGFHQHKRQWRKSSMDPQQTIVPATSAPPAPVDEQVLINEGWKALRTAIAMQADLEGKRGKARELAKVQVELDRRTAVRQVLRDYPMLWSRLRRLLSNAEGVLIKAMTDDQVARELLEYTLKGMRNELGYQQAPILEKLLIEQVTIAYLDYDFVQQAYAQKALSSHTLSSGAYWDRRVNSAQARYTRAVEALARVRRLAMPQPLQVNIGGQQVNVAGG